MQRVIVQSLKATCKDALAVSEWTRSFFVGNIEGSSRDYDFFYRGSFSKASLRSRDMTVIPKGNEGSLP